MKFIKIVFSKRYKYFVGSSDRDFSGYNGFNDYIFNFYY